MWVSWVTLLAAVAGAAWVWPGAGSAAPDALLPSKLWILSWPVLTGALGAWLACGAFGPRGRRRWPEIPAGDLLAAADWAFVTLRRRWPAGAFRILASRRRAVATSVHTALVLGVTRRFEGSTETRLRAWPNVGLLLLLLSGALLLALAW
jgi:hypothetical protein